MAVSAVSKVSDITVDDIVEYLRIAEPSQEELLLLSSALTVAKDYIKSYTGLNDEQMDAHCDLITVVYVLCSDMFDNRAYYVDKSNINLIVDSILNLHSINLLPAEETP